VSEWDGLTIDFAGSATTRTGHASAEPIKLFAGTSAIRTGIFGGLDAHKCLPIAGAVIGCLLGA